MSHRGVALHAPPSKSELGTAASEVLWRGRPVRLGRGGSSASSGAGAASDAEYFIVEFVRAGGQTRLPVSSQGKGSKKGFRAILFGETAPAAAFWEDWRRMLPPGCPIDSLG